MTDNLQFDSERTRNAAFHHLYSALVMFQKAGMGLWQFLRMVGQDWHNAGSLLCKLTNPKK